MKTVIFDMDGVIFDTERRMLQCWKEEAARRGLGNVVEAYRKCIGATPEYNDKIFREQFPDLPPYREFVDRPSRAFRELNERCGMPVKRGIRELLQYLKDSGYRIGLASSSRYADIQKELRMADLDGYFDKIVGGDHVKRSKPEPDIYIAACQAIDARPEEAYAVEDSYNGIRSASRAGMMPIMVPDMLEPTPEMEGLCVAVLQDLTAVKQYFMQKDGK